MRKQTRCTRLIGCQAHLSTTSTPPKHSMRNFNIECLCYRFQLQLESAGPKSIEIRCITSRGPLPKDVFLMASQYTTDIPFSASHAQQPFKLLELPPDLLALLESDTPPGISITSSPATATGPGYALLCYGDKKYQMRSKNTSNPIMVLKPSSTGPTGSDDTETFISSPSITSIAKIEETIELIPQASEASAPIKINKWHEKFAKSRITKS